MKKTILKNSHQKDTFYLQQMISKFLWLLALSAFVPLSAMQAQCDFYEGDISLTVTNANTDAAFATEYYLTDANDNIVQVSNTPSFTTVTASSYKVYSVNYKISDGINNNTVGNTINDISGACFELGEALFIKVCGDVGCEYYTGETVSLQITNTGNENTGFTTSYILTDAIGNILETNATPSFTIDEMGNYNIYGLNYEASNGISGLAVGENVEDIAGLCFDLGVPYCFTVCPTDCTWYSDTYIFYSKGGNESAEFTTVYVLTDENGQVVNTNSTPIFTNLMAGTYLIYPVNYETALGINGLTVGNSISDIADGCLAIGVPLPFRYCPCGPDCDISPNNSFTFNSAGENTDTEFTTEFLLVDMDGNIIDKSATAQFGNVSLGQYQIIAINYENTNAPSGLNAGDNLIDIAGVCLDFSEPICLNVCDTCSPIRCMPIIITKTTN